ncbi:hypothetical protein PsYK624_164350 [Phanerochaete sordida]|uniref:Uncharacterized protein n=1 Tax=Phanerochaete sordida TaxID=48140 RepID=A0A9P3GW17_9APHY|nr:hypothetical protein PsYK624_164350 [Phanerochaete sordida]
MVGTSTLPSPVISADFFLLIVCHLAVAIHLPPTAYVECHALDIVLPTTSTCITLVIPIAVIYIAPSIT